MSSYTTGNPQDTSAYSSQTGHKDAKHTKDDSIKKHKTDSHREYDIVLYGATSFVGKLTAAYLQKFLETTEATLATEQKISWAIAGRNQQKLDAVKQEIGNSDLATIIADSEQQQSVDEMAANAKVIISTVGPYLKYGEPLIKACANYGTDYVDLTGEALFIKDMMDKYSSIAQRSGARIVNSCGFDSIPSDLGVLFTQNYAKQSTGQYCDTIAMRVKVIKGGLSGGTIASMATIFTAVAEDKSRRQQLSNPYLLVDDTNPPTLRQNAIHRPQWDAQNKHWLAPFVMASINTCIVHRSHQLHSYPYGRHFKYDEAIWMPAGIKGRVMSYGMLAGLVGFAAGMAFTPSRELLNDHILPKAGTGPSVQERENGHFDIRFIGSFNGNNGNTDTNANTDTTANTPQIRTKVTGAKDPGYGSTCEMLAQSALCLLQQAPQQEVAGGFWTPASAMGTALISRLQAYSDIKFETLT